MNKPPLTLEDLDTILEKARTDPKKERIIWTLPAIARRIGVGTDFVRDTIAKLPGSPIKEIGGRYYCFESDLINFLRFENGNNKRQEADSDGGP